MIKNISKYIIVGLLVATTVLFAANGYEDRSLYLSELKKESWEEEASERVWIPSISTSSPEKVK